MTKINLEPRGTTLRILGGRARFSPHGAGVDGLRIEAPEGSVSSDVRFAFRGTNRFQLKTAGTLRGESLGAWLEPLAALRGNLNAEFAMPAAGGAPAFADVKVAKTLRLSRNLPSAKAGAPPSSRHPRPAFRVPRSASDRAQPRAERLAGRVRPSSAESACRLETRSARRSDAFRRLNPQAVDRPRRVENRAQPRIRSVVPRSFEVDLSSQHQARCRRQGCRARQSRRE